MTNGCIVDHELVKKLAVDLGSTRQLIELVATIAGYNCVSRVICALDITLADEPGK
jgi:alkylhydroperoxidase family enzyme